MPRVESPMNTRLRTDFLLTAILDPSVVNSSRYHDEPPTNRHFPGKTLAGAHYIFLEVADLIMFCISNPTDLGMEKNGQFDVDEFIRRVGGFRKGVAIESQAYREKAGHVTSALNNMLIRCEF